MNDEIYVVSLGNGNYCDWFRGELREAPRQVVKSMDLKTANKIWNLARCLGASKATIEFVVIHHD
jgi:hypothetical protein